MSIWEILQIEPTDNISTIKKAYAKLLKIYHPEDDPEGYQKLREAYDRAIKSVKQMRNQANEFPNDHSVQTTFYPTNDNQSVINGTQSAISTVVHPVQDFMVKLEVFYDDFFARLNQENWEILLSSDVIWNVQYADVLKDRLIEFLVYHHHFPRPIWKLIDSVFRFSEQKEDLELEYDDNTVQFLLDKINGSREMGYDIFNQNDKLNYDWYFELREEAQQALMFNDLETAKDVLDQAYQLFVKDPDLLRMRGIYFLRMENIEQALNSFNELLSVSQDDPDGLLYRARIFINLRQFNDAKKDCVSLLSIYPEHKNAQFMLTKCLTSLGDWEESHKTIQNALERDIKQPEFFWYNVLTINRRGQLKQSKKYNLWFILFLFIRRTWVYFAFFIIALFTPLPFKYAVWLLIPLIWEMWKCLGLKIK